MRIGDWLELAITIENRSAELYERFAVLFRKHSRLADYWKQMKDDEIRHKSILQSVIDDLEEDDRNRIVRQGVADKTDKLLSCVTSDLAKMFSNLDDAYECAHELEEKEVEVIFDLLKEDSINKYEGVHTLLREDQEHLQRLMDFGDSFGKAEWRRLIDPSKEK